MLVILIGLLVILLSGTADAQVTLSGPVSLNGGASAIIGVAPPTVNECDLPLSFAGNQGANCMRTVYKASVWDRRSGITYGADLGQQKLTTDTDGTGSGNIVAAIPPGTAAAPGSHPSMRLTGNVPPQTGWLAMYDPASHPTYGDGETCVDWMDSEVSGEGCGGAAILITEGSNQTTGSCGGGNDGAAYIGMACEAKGTDTHRIERINTCTGARTSLATESLAGKIDVYGGSVPPANCDHNRGQLDWHMYCQWVQTCLRLQTSGGNVTLTLRSWRVGKSGGWAKGDAQNNDPGPPSGTTTYTRYLMETTAVTEARPANIGATGPIGIAGGSLTGSTQDVSVTNLRFSVTPQAD